MQITSAMLAGGVAELMIAWLDGRLDIPQDRLIKDCATLVVGLGDTAAALAQHRKAPGEASDNT